MDMGKVSNTHAAKRARQEKSQQNENENENQLELVDVYYYSKVELYLQRWPLNRRKLTKLYKTRYTHIHKPQQ